MTPTATKTRNIVEGCLNMLLRFAPRFVRDLAERYRSLALLAILSTTITLLTVSALLVIKLVSAPVYTATTLIQPYLLTKEHTKDSGLAPLDGKMLVDGAIQIVESHALARKIAEKLKLDSQATGTGLFSPVLKYFNASTTGDRSQALDLAARAITQKLTVTNPRKSHMIEVSYSAQSPEQAALIANAVASEYIVFNQTTDIAKAHAKAQQQYAELSTRYGAGHPRVIAAKRELELVQEKILVAENSMKLLTPRELLSTGLVIPASPISLPSNRRLWPTIASGLVLGSLMSLALFLLLEPAARTAVSKLAR